MRKLFILLLTIFSIVLLCLPKLCYLTFQTVDDSMYIEILSGNLNGTPCPYTVFLGAIYSHFLAGLYSLSRHIEWYALFNHICSILAFLNISFCLSKTSFEYIYKCIFLSAFFVIQLYLCLFPQYTLVSEELVLSACLVLLFRPFKHVIFNEIIVFILFFIGAEIRLNGALLVTLILFPLILFYFFNKKLKFYGTLSFTILMLATAFVYVTNIAMSPKSEDWSYYNNYNKGRGYLADNPQSSLALNVLQDINKKAEYTLSGCQDGNIINDQIMLQCARYVSSRRPLVDVNNLRSYLLCYNRLGGIIVLIMIAMTLCLSISLKQYKLLLQSVFVLFFFAIANLYMMITSGPKERVIIMSLFCLFIAFSYLLYLLCPKKYVVITFVLIPGIFCGIYSEKTYNEYQVMSQRLLMEEEIDDLLLQVPYRKVQILVASKGITQAFWTSNSVFWEKNVGLGWMVNHPEVKKVYSGLLSYTKDLPILVAKGDESVVSPIQQLLKNYYHVETRRKVLAESENYYIFMYEIL